MLTERTYTNCKKYKYLKSVRTDTTTTRYSISSTAQLLKTTILFTHSTQNECTQMRAQANLTDPKSSIEIQFDWLLGQRPSIKFLFTCTINLKGQKHRLPLSGRCCSIRIAHCLHTNSGAQYTSARVMNFRFFAIRYTIENGYALVRMCAPNPFISNFRYDFFFMLT